MRPGTKTWANSATYKLFAPRLFAKSSCCYHLVASESQSEVIVMENMSMCPGAKGLAPGAYSSLLFPLSYKPCCTVLPLLLPRANIIIVSYQRPFVAIDLSSLQTLSVHSPSSPTARRRLPPPLSPPSAPPPVRVPYRHHSPSLGSLYTSTEWCSRKSR